MAARRKAAVAGLMLSACLAAGACDAHEPQTRSDGPVERRATVPAQEAFEDCIPIESGQTLRYRFDAAAALTFDVHYHEQGRSLYVAQPQATRAETLSITAREARLYCLLWRNAGDRPVSLTFAYTISGP